MFASLDTARMVIYPATGAENVGKAPVKFLEWQLSGDVVAESKLVDPNSERSLVNDL